MSSSDLDVREFRRSGSGLSPGFLYFVTAWIGLSSVVHLAERQWLLGLAGVALACLGLAQNIWVKGTPIVRLTGQEVVVHRTFLAPARRITIGSIGSVDQPRPSAVRLNLRDGRGYVIPLHWLEWGDRPSLIEALNSAVAAARH